MSEKHIKIALQALANKGIKAPAITESRMTYESGHNERMNPMLAKQLRDRGHSLGTHPIFPDSDESHFEEKLMSKRFTDVLKTFKRYHNAEIADLTKFYTEQGALLMNTVKLEKKHKKELEELAIKLVREDYDMSEEDVEIIANLTTEFSDMEIKTRLQPEESDMEFDSHQDLVDATGEVYKRRFVNAMIQGSAKKVNHMFNMVDSELQELDPLLPANYAKIMSAADYSYMIENGTDTPKMVGGTVKVEFPKVAGNRPKIIASAITLPVLIHELVKGAMEILASHGLPKKPGMAKYVMGKADFVDAEVWDMRLGPPIWEKFIDALPPEDFNLKQHVFIELVALPVKEFNEVMREIMMGSRAGKAKVQSIINEIKDDLRNDAFNDAMGHLNDDEYFNPEDLDNIDDEDWFM
jgi:hypothetical protein